MTVATVLALFLICGLRGRVRHAISRFRHPVLVMMFRMRMRIGNR